MLDCVFHQGLDGQHRDPDLFGRIIDVDFDREPRTQAKLFDLQVGARISSSSDK